MRNSIGSCKNEAHSAQSSVKVAHGDGRVCRERILFALWCLASLVPTDRTKRHIVSLSQARQHFPKVNDCCCCWAERVGLSFARRSLHATRLYSSRQQHAQPLSIPQVSSSWNEVMKWRRHGCLLSVWDRQQLVVVSAASPGIPFICPFFKILIDEWPHSLVPLSIVAIYSIRPTIEIAQWPIGILLAERFCFVIK